MSLSDKLSEACNKTTLKFCKVGSLLVSPNIPEQDRENLKKVLEVDQLNPNRIQNNTIARILREEGYDISDSSVDRHRRNDCPCSRTVK
jgi:hypothetical protein